MKEATVQRYERECGEYQGDTKEALLELKAIKALLTAMNSNLQYLIELKIAERDR